MGNMYSLAAANPKGFADAALSRSTFVATNPTPGTGILSSDANTTLSATVGLMNIFNSSDTTGSEPYVIIPCWLKLQATAANSNATDFNLIFYLDEIDRYDEGGTTITPQPLIQSSETGFTDPTTKATINFGILTLNAATDANLVTRIKLTDVMAVDDLLEIYWGDGPDTGQRDGTVLRGPGSFIVPPMWIRPGANLSLHEFADSQTVSFDPEFEFVYVERPNAN